MGRYRVKKNGIPILSHADINRIGGYFAESIRHLDDAGREIVPDTLLPEAVDLEKLLRLKFGEFHLVEDRYLSPSGSLLGLTAFSGGSIRIFDPASPERSRSIVISDNTIMIDRRLSAEELTGMRRFTLTHEMGHALFHRLFCRDPENMQLYAVQGSEKRPVMLVDDGSCYEVVADNRIRNEHDWLEWQANAFAAALLLPEKQVRAVSARLREDLAGDAGCDPDHERIWLNELVILLQDIFQVSETTALFRLKNLGIAPEGCRFSDAGILI